jgi:hypothetical protein
MCKERPCTEESNGSLTSLERAKIHPRVRPKQAVNDKVGAVSVYSNAACGENGERVSPTRRTHPLDGCECVLTHPLGTHAKLRNNAQTNGAICINYKRAAAMMALARTLCVCVSRRTLICINNRLACHVRSRRCHRRRVRALNILRCRRAQHV